MKMNMYKLALQLYATSAVKVYSNGVALEETGDMYIHSGFEITQVWVHRERPLKQFEELDFDNCYCIYSMPINYNGQNAKWRRKNNLWTT
mgnify:CR=1 FL=1